ncbi:hypothetical protein [Bacillus sp. SA1-12]|uniref:hypothetical protein n=1 Tax=Bacillus sp. SA1-12 TaxID=1455638 RepID=UPI000AF506EA|nr:hypothetical protein [Bacillus sp. SA1-12]
MTKEKEKLHSNDEHEEKQLSEFYGMSPEESLLSVNFAPPENRLLNEQSRQENNNNK